MTAILEAMQTTTLAALTKGAVATVIGFAEGNDEAVRKLLALGVAPGDKLRILATGHACMFEVGSARYAIDRELATRVLVTGK